MKKKPSVPQPNFPREREEFAGELTPGLYPGPVTRAHPGRFRKEKKPSPAPEENTGVWTPEG